MLKVSNFMMETCKFITILLLYCACTAYCYPVKPLNERSPELTWQAWLLVDDQNQNQNKQQTNADGVLRRRITPKSVFIAPTFSPESLPPCPEGYDSAPMGRCIKIIKLNQDAHSKFWENKLVQQFGSDYDYEEEQPTPGPYQVNIPLGIDNEGSEEETDMAIVVSPTITQFGEKGINLDKRDSASDQDMQEMLLKRLAETTTKKNDDTTTVTEPSTTLVNNEETTTMTENLSAFTEAIATTDDDSFTSTDSQTVKRSTTDLDDAGTTSTEELPTTTTTDPTTISYREMTTLAPKVQVTQIESSTPNLIRFPDKPKAQALLDPSFVKFPDSDISFQTQIPSSLEQMPSTRDANKHFPGFEFPTLSDSPAADRRVVFRDPSHVEVANLDYSNGAQRQLAPSATHRNFNRRNRDKHNNMFLLPPRWNQPNFQKPLVLRFSRKHAYFDESQFKNPAFYRSIPSDDFAYLFKFKHKQLSHR